MLPGSKHRIMPSPRSTTNLACTWSLHNYPQAKRVGNPIGDGSALIPLKLHLTLFFYLNCHTSEIGKDVTGQKYAGHTLTLGASGTGKTTLLVQLLHLPLVSILKFLVSTITAQPNFFIKSFGGNYYSIKEGHDTGLNPFQLPDTPELRSFLNRLVYTLCADNNHYCNEQEEQEIKSAIDSVMRLDINKGV